MRRFGRCFAGLLAWVPFWAGAGELPPDYSKLVFMPPCPALVAAAGEHQVPVEGIDPPSEGGLGVGDSATALVTLCQKHSRPQQWLLSVTAMPRDVGEKAEKSKLPSVWYTCSGEKLEFDASTAPVSLRLLGPFAAGEGKAKPPKADDQSARCPLNQGFLALGLDQAAAAIQRIHQGNPKEKFSASPKPLTAAQIEDGKKVVAALRLTLAEQRSLVGSIPALLSYFELVQHTPGLDKLFFKVVDLPSVWSLVRHVGVKANLELQPDLVGPTDLAAWHLPGQPAGYHLPMVFRLNDQPALGLTLVVAPPASPLLACGGIVGLLAEKPSEKETYLTVWLLSAKRQTGPAPAK